MEDAEYRQAQAVGDALVDHGPVAVSARYDQQTRQVAILLRSGLELRVSPSDVEGLEGASDEQLVSVEVEPPGLMLRWDRRDAELFLPYLLDEKLGDDRWVRLIHRLGLLHRVWRTGRSRTRVRRRA
jgi:hypothetical protein